MNTTSRRTGGSILPSSSPLILQPMPYKYGTLQVKAVPEHDTHILTITTPQGEQTLANHPNGYSCHALAKRMVSDTRERAIDQAQYIIDCGGSADLEALSKLIY